MERWDTAMRQSQLRERMGRLAPDSLTVFTVGCTTHARDVIIRLAGSADSSVYQSATRLLDEFWSNYPDVLDELHLQSYINGAGALAPSEDTELAPGEGPILWSMLYAFKCRLGKEMITDAMNAVSEAYHAIFAFQYERGEYSRDDVEIDRLEMDNEACLAEIRFQLCLLRNLEEVHGTPPSYSALMEGMTEKE